MHRPANPEVALSMTDMLWNHKIHNLKNLPRVPPPPSPSPSESESTHQEQLEASKLLGPELFTSIQHQDMSSLLSVLEKIITQRGLHISEIVDQVTRAGNTMLHIAAMYERREILELIADHFPQLITRKNIQMDTVLHVAARTRNPELMRIVIDCYNKSHFASNEDDNDDDEDGEKVPWRIENKHGNVALHEAVMACNVEGVELLFTVDEAVALYLNKEGKSPLYLAVENRNNEIISILLQAPFLNRKRHQGTSPLHAAILARSAGERTITNTQTKPGGGPTSMTISHYELLKMLMKKRPELIYLKDQKGRLPLHYAASMGDVEAVRTLVNASPSSALEWNMKGYLPVHVACRKGHVNVVKELVQQSWFNPMESLNPKGQNILHIAAKRGKDRVVKYILREEKLESLLNQKDRSGNTPLHLASKYLFPIVFLLLTQEKSLNINLLNNRGMTARDIVMFIRRTPPTIRELLSYAILNSIGAPLTENGRRLRRSLSKTPQVEWIKDRVSTILVVAILVATVTFAAGFTMPGGFYSSEDHEHPEKIGIAALLNRRMFQLFTISDVIAMYSSTMGSFILLWAQLGDFHLAFSATYLALCFMGLALVTMSIAFMAAVHLVVGNLSWLASSVMTLGIIFIMMFLSLFIFLTFPLGAHRFLLCHISNIIFRIIIPFSGSYSKFKRVRALGESKKDEVED